MSLKMGVSTSMSKQSKARHAEEMQECSGKHYMFFPGSLGNYLQASNKERSKAVNGVHCLDSVRMGWVLWPTSTSSTSYRYTTDTDLEAVGYNASCIMTESWIMTGSWIMSVWLQGHTVGCQ